MPRTASPMTSGECGMIAVCPVRSVTYVSGRSQLRACCCAPSSVRRWLRLFCRKHATMRIAAAGDRLLPSPRIGSDQIMLKAQIAQAVQLLDLMLEYFADDGHWTRGRYDDGDGGHCLVGALLHLSREHRLPRAPRHRGSSRQVRPTALAAFWSP